MTEHLPKITWAACLGLALTAYAFVPQASAPQVVELPPDGGWSAEDRKAWAIEAVAVAIREAPLETTLAVLRRARDLGVMPDSETLEAALSGTTPRPVPARSWGVYERGVFREFVEVRSSERWGR